MSGEATRLVVMQLCSGDLMMLGGWGQGWRRVCEELSEASEDAGRVVSLER